jgi:hypothetical protein
MTRDSWLQPHLEAVLRNRLAVLDRWRDQISGLSGQIKNFENWILVELVHELLSTVPPPRCVLTNGFLAEGEDVLSAKHMKGADVFGSSGRSKAVHLSVDLSVRQASGETLVAEIKTGLGGLTLLDDVTRVLHYQATVATRAEVGWAVVLPKDSVPARSAKKSIARIIRLLEQNPAIRVVPTEITDWLYATVIVPVVACGVSHRIAGAPGK